jgi:hypothetical protein
VRLVSSDFCPSSAAARQAACAAVTLTAVSIRPCRRL